MAVKDTWRKGIVVSHVQHDDAKGDNPPWTRVVQFEDGTAQPFDWRDLCRNGTHPNNTEVGAVIWVDQRGAVSAQKPGDA